MTSDPTTGKTFGYSSENRLTSASGGVTLTYDPLGRLYETNAAGTVRRFLYAPGPGEDGLPLILAEYDGSGAPAAHYAYGPAPDEPLLWWSLSEGIVRPLVADERGSVTAILWPGAGASWINRYDEFGKPQAGNAGRFQYTGQAWLPEPGVYHYKNRAYHAGLGRFLQTDPIGYWDSSNLYAYVGNDPVNFTDPLGLGPQDIVIVACQNGGIAPNCNKGAPERGRGFGSGWLGGIGSIGGGETGGAVGADITVFAPPRPVRSKTSGLWSDFVRGLRTTVCSIPAVGWGGGADLYALLGGSISGGYSVDLRNGRIGVFYSTGVGVGVGGGPYTALYVNPATGISATLSANVGGGALYGAGASYGLIGTGAGGAGGTGVRASTRAGAMLGANANISADASLGIKLYDLGCD